MIPAMATPQAALRAMRSICRTLEDVSEADHFGEVCFRVGKRMFATCGEKDGVCRVVVQLEPAHARRLLATDRRFQPYPRQEHCVWIRAGDVANWDEVRPLVLESYRLVGSRANKKTRGNRKRKNGS